ncbi:MAG: site-specific DNA-methyltransferase [Promethearchaeota archaeon]
MANLNWKGKNKDKMELNNSPPFFIKDIFPSKLDKLKTKNGLPNLLIFGDNLLILNSLLDDFAEKINLIYIDPPFATGGDYNLKIPIGDNKKIINDLAYDDKWKEGLDSYIDFMYNRLILMKKLLSQKGSIYIHLDWHVSHYIKIIMDDVFGPENFRNEIIWAYPAASARTKRFFMRSFDVILFYTKSKDYIFNDNPNIYMEYSDRVKNALKKDEKGIFYYRGGSHNGKKLSRKVYVTKKGIFPRDVWNDIPYVRANTSEYQGFSTQKPERLLKRIILASTNEKDIVADFFCGSGTTLAVAEKLERRWIGCDSNAHAIHMSRKRILNIKNSKDMIKWKNLYNKDYRSFNILCFEKDNKTKSIPSVFLNENIQNKNEFQINENPYFEVKIQKNNNKISVELINYSIPFKNLISEKVNYNIKSFSDWIDYWAIDFNNQKDSFRNLWFSYRTPKNRMLSLISDIYQYNESGTYNISVKTIDIFGIETLKSFIINII